MCTAVLAGTAVAGGALLYYLYRQRRCRQPKLVLHFDVNETIMVGDPAGGDSFEDCLNKMICKNALVRAKKPGADPLKAQSVSELVWWDGTPMLEQGAPAVGEHVPPLRGDWVWPDGCVPFYKVKALKKQTNGGRAFTQPGSPGCIYRAQLEELEQALRVPEGARAGLDPRLCHDGVHWFLLPSFFHTLHALHAAGRDCAPIFCASNPGVA